MLPRRIPFNQIAFAAVIGIGGGIYIYGPMFNPHRNPTSTTDGANVTAEAGDHGQAKTSSPVPNVKRSEAAQDVAALTK